MCPKKYIYFFFIKDFHTFVQIYYLTIAYYHEKHSHKHTDCPLYRKLSIDYTSTEQHLVAIQKPGDNTE